MSKFKNNFFFENLDVLHYKMSRQKYHIKLVNKHVIRAYL